ncbi:hypothetical protein N7537_005809 [Penicillium hordei]|uniref:Amidohydrolase n=1 Tax=Penicillium hordei TaxID=40994 RepID=A0AAD6E6S9_9EURO|nr:uncharacterized protein N7537_005809 [Penicillium hordei]KAJ5602853.1 hypothetical protein N7537_005809 [Penicillium hordei]
MATPSKNAVQAVINQYIDSLTEPVTDIHETPELVYKEHVAYDAICEFLQSQGIQTTRHAYGPSTTFEAKFVNGDSCSVDFNAEYDAFPGIGHACGHNLVAIQHYWAFSSGIWR